MYYSLLTFTLRVTFHRIRYCLATLNITDTVVELLLEKHVYTRANVYKFIEAYSPHREILNGHAVKIDRALQGVHRVVSCDRRLWLGDVSVLTLGLGLRRRVYQVIERDNTLR